MSLPAPWGFYFRAFRSPGSPRAPAGYHYEAKLRIASAGLSPASTAASLAAPKHKTVLDGFTPDAGEGPSFIKVRRRVLYDIEVLDTWLKERVRRHTGESGDA